VRAQGKDAHKADRKLPAKRVLESKKEEKDRRCIDSHRNSYIKFRPIALLNVSNDHENSIIEGGGSVVFSSEFWEKLGSPKWLTLTKKARICLPSKREA